MCPPQPPPPRPLRRRGEFAEQHDILVPRPGYVRAGHLASRPSAYPHLRAVIVAGSVPCAAQRRFTVADDIGLSYFGVPNTLEDAFVFSPDGQYFVVHTERGRVDLNRPESTLRIYRTEDVHQFLQRAELSSEPQPVWAVSRSTYKYGPIITNLRWLADSSGIAFLAKAETGNGAALLRLKLEALSLCPC
jgi:hypothetical protein